MQSGAINQTLNNKIIEEYSQTLAGYDLKQLVKELFSYLDYKEESDSGREFHPVCISNCRVLLTEPLNMLLDTLRYKVAQND